MLKNLNVLRNFNHSGRRKFAANYGFKNSDPFYFFFRTMILIPNSFFTRRGTHWAVVGAYQQGNSNFLKRFILYVTGVFWCGGIRILLFYVSSFFGCVITQKLICVVEKKERQSCWAYKICNLAKKRTSLIKNQQFTK